MSRADNISIPSLRGVLHTSPRLWAVFCLALAVRLALLGVTYDSTYTAGMAQGELARNLAEGRGFVVNGIVATATGLMQDSLGRLVDIEDVVRRLQPADSREDLRPFIAYMMPGQGILLAVTYMVFGDYRYIYLQVLQAVIDSFSVFLLAWMGSMTLGKQAGFLGAVLFALYVPEARLAVSATRDAWMPIIYLCSAAAMVAAWKSGSLRYWLLFGIAVAVGAYFRSEILLLPVAALALHMIMFRKPRSLVKPLLLSIIPAVLLIAPWTIRNYQTFGRVIPTNAGLWLALWQSFGEYKNDFGAVNNDEATFRQTREWGYTVAFDTPDYDDIFKERVLRVIAEEPVWVAWTMTRRLARIPFQMHAWGIPYTEEMTAENEAYPVGRVDLETYWNYLTADPWRLAVHGVARSVNVVLYASVVIWFFLAGVSDRVSGLLVSIVPLYNILVHVVIGVHARYILPTNEILLLFLAGLVLWLYQKRNLTPPPTAVISP